MSQSDILTFTTDSFGEHRWIVKAPNGQVVLAATEGYVHRGDAEANARRHLFLATTRDTNEFRVMNRQQVNEHDLVSMSEPTLDMMLAHAEQRGRDLESAQAGSADTGGGTRVVLVKAGDSIVFGNVGELDGPGLEEFDEACRTLKHTLQLRNVFAFEADIDMQAVKA